MDELTPTGGTIGAIGAGVASLIAGIFWLRKTIASTGADIAGDRAEIQMITVLQDENKELRQRLSDTEKERNEQWKQIADMSAQIQIIQAKMQALTQTNQALTEEVQRLRISLEARP